MRQIINRVQIKGERSWHLMVHSWPSLTRAFLLLCWSKAVNISAQSAFTSIARHWKLNLPNSCWNDFHIFLLLVAQINVELNVAKIKHFFLSEKSFVKKGLEKKFLLENFLRKKVETKKLMSNDPVGAREGWKLYCGCCPWHCSRGLLVGMATN